MYVQTGKTFIATLIAVVMALGGIAWLSSGSHKSEPTALAESTKTSQSAVAQSDAAYASTADTNATSSSSGNQPYEEGYKAGYRDGHQDCLSSRSSYRRTSYVGRRYYAPRARVAGATYYAQPRRGHSTRNMILTIAGPAAIGAGIGAIAKGGKGAGIGALLGGGGGALYYLYKHRNR